MRARLLLTLGHLGLSVMLLAGLHSCMLVDDDDSSDDDDDDSAGDDDDSAGDDDDSDLPLTFEGDEAGECIDGADNDQDGDYDCDDSDCQGAPDCDDEDGDGAFAFEDCDDLDEDSYPGADELCDEVDNDCDEEIDEGVEDTWFADADSDGYGGSTFEVQACDPPPGYVGNNEDCDDLDPDAYPGAVEACDEIDNDCDGVVDNGGGAPTTWFADYDGDNFGSDSTSIVACAAPPGFIATSGDCDDLAAAVFPGALEVCDGVDNNCDAAIDDGAAAPSNWFADSDADGFGNSGGQITSCIAPPGYVTDSSDCDDLNPTVFPGAAEICDGIDNDCDTSIDDGLAAPSTWFADFDADGFGNPSNPVTACNAPTSYVSDSSDCNDLEPASFPGNAEICDGVDNDCDGGVDLGSIDAPNWYFDSDGDGYGTSNTFIVGCTAASNHVGNSDDCDDSSALSSPAGTEVADDGIDQDCNGFDSLACTLDGDGDSFGSASAQLVVVDSAATCLAGGASTSSDDCDDNAAGVNPAAAEQTDDGIDQDCNGFDALTCIVDNDGDGHGNPAGTTLVVTAAASCAAGGASLTSDDCDDTAGSGAATFPGAPQLCDSVADNDCVGGIDPNESSDDADPESECQGDCDDADPANFSSNLEICDGQDNNCVGGADFDSAGETDGDNDGFRTCEGDCDDADGAINPAATELCDGVDNDCAGGADFDSAGETDGDNDGFRTCEGDCDDADGNANPNATEIQCNSIDEDCDGTAQCSDPCSNYGGTHTTINTNIKVCTNDLTWGAWNNSQIGGGWTVCTLSQWQQYAPSGSPSSYGLDTLWIDNSSCGSNMHREVYVSYPMNDASCYNGNSCCWGDSTSLRFAICSP